MRWFLPCLLLACTPDFAVVDASVDADLGEDAALPPCTPGESCDDQSVCTTRDLCTAEGCLGQRITCDQHTTQCDGHTLVEQAASGVCDPVDGCEIVESREPCPYSCSDGACVPCEVNPWRFEVAVRTESALTKCSRFARETGGREHILFTNTTFTPTGRPTDHILHYVRHPGATQWRVTELHQTEGVRTCEIMAQDGALHGTIQTREGTFYLHWDGEWDDDWGADWTMDAVDIPFGDGTVVSLCVKSDNAPRMMATNAIDVIEYQRGEGGWTERRLFDGGGSFFRCAVDGRDRSHMVYSRLDRTYYTYSEGNEWPTQDIGESVATMALAVDANDVAHILAHRSSDRLLAYGEMGGNPDTWVLQALPDLGQTDRPVAIALHGNQVHIAYQNRFAGTHYGRRFGCASFEVQQVGAFNMRPLSLHLSTEGDVFLAGRNTTETSGHYLHARRFVCPQ